MVELLMEDLKDMMNEIEGKKNLPLEEVIDFKTFLSVFFCDFVK